MKTILLVVGKTTDSHIEALTKDYVSRIGHYMPFSIEVIPELRNAKSLTFDQQKEREAEYIRKQLQPADYVVMLDEHGTERRSVDFAKWIQKKTLSAPRRLVFLVGGPYGFSPQIHSLANEKISISQMTFSHQMIRLLFVEQIYRAMTILHGEPYHHE
ncbi:MAG: 23S rRNA (pseudouridine(1915)-N(3))-methyltransferase RlmH [Bacteroidales bacterium]|nr:23S rRNA (pseudouridine(1915)-N(3))-methyltransferase RlmH [Candidatus Physcousia equi]